MRRLWPADKARSMQWSEQCTVCRAPASARESLDCADPQPEDGGMVSMWCRECNDDWDPEDECRRHDWEERVEPVGFQGYCGYAVSTARICMLSRTCSLCGCYEPVRHALVCEGCSRLDDPPLENFVYDTWCSDCWPKAVDTSNGAQLTELAGFLGLRRLHTEDDDALRRRIRWMQSMS